MGSPINRTAKTALDGNLVNGVTSDAPRIKANNDVIYDYVDGLNTQIEDILNPAEFPYADGVITEPKIADSAVSTNKIKNRNVTRVKIALGAVGTDEIDPAILTGTSAGIVQANLDAHKQETANETELGHVRLATKAEAEAGTNATKVMTPQRTKQAIDKFIPNTAISYFGTTAGTNAYTTTLSPVPDNYFDGMCIVLRFGNTNTTVNTTVNCNAKGAKALRDSEGNQFKIGELKGTMMFRYNEAVGNFHLMGKGGGNTRVPEVGNVEIFLSETITTTKNTTLIKTREYEWLGKNGAIRIHMLLSTQSGSTNVSARIYINGVAVGTLRNTTSFSGVVFTEDFNINTGDLIQIYQSSGSATIESRTTNISFSVLNNLVAKTNLE